MTGITGRTKPSIPFLTLASTGRIKWYMTQIPYQQRYQALKYRPTRRAPMT